jgi:cytosine/adenosine deaminase-related metal-dependent hydrolase
MTLVLQRRLLLVSAVILAVPGCAPRSPRAESARIEQVPLDGAGYPVQVCDASYAGRAAACTISGAGPGQLIRANIISDGQLYVGGSLRIGADGRIQAAGCEVPQAAAVTLDCPGALVSAGFLNLHEHIEYSYEQSSHPPPRTWGHRHEWGLLSQEELGFSPISRPKREDPAIFDVSERALLRHALSGSTAIAGAKEYRAFLRNLRLKEGALAVPAGNPLWDDTFPLGDAVSKAQLQAPCAPDRIEELRKTISPDKAYVPHVGEGTNEPAHREVECLLQAVSGKKTPSAFIHALAASEAQAERLKAQHIAVVLSPRSNFQLYGKTAPLAALKRAGVTLAIGTDWSRSGSLTQLDELRCLARYNRDRLQGLFSWADMHRMMTENGAAAVGLQGQIGKLAAGESADLVILDTRGRRSLGEILESSALAETLAVFIGGRAASFPSAWEGKLAQLENCSRDPRDLCGQQRTVCGANPQRSLEQLLKQPLYTIDDARICRPQPTDDCIER